MSLDVFFLSFLEEFGKNWYYFLYYYYYFFVDFTR